MLTRKISLTLALVLLIGYHQIGLAEASSQEEQPVGSVIELPEDFQIEKVVDGLTYPTSIIWDDQGQMYVAEAGGQFLEEPPPARILRVEGGQPPKSST